MTYDQLSWIYTLNSSAKSSFRLKPPMTFWFKNLFLNIDSPLSLPSLKTNPLGAKSQKMQSSLSNITAKPIRKINITTIAIQQTIYIVITVAR